MRSLKVDDSLAVTCQENTQGGRDSTELKNKYEKPNSVTGKERTFLRVTIHTLKLNG